MFDLIANVLLMAQVLGQAPPSELASPAWWLSRAVAAAEQVEPVEVRIQLLVTILDEYAKCGDEAAALRILDSIEKLAPKEQALALRAQGAEILARAGLSAAVDQLAARVADNNAGPVKEKFVVRDSLLEEVARHHTLRGDFERAVATANQITRDANRARAVQFIAYQQADTDWEAALATLKTSPAGSDALFIFTDKAARAGRWDMVAELTRFALEYAPRLSIDWHAIVYRNLGKRLSELDRAKLDPMVIDATRAAMTQFVRQPKPENLPANSFESQQFDSAIAAACEGLIDLGEHDVAREAIGRTSEFHQSVLHMRLAAALARAGRYEEALQEAKLTNLDHNAYGEIADAQAARGDMDKALQTAKLIAREDSRNAAYSSIIRALLQVNRVEQAKEATLLMEREIGADWKTNQLQIIARHEIKAKRNEDAKKTIVDALATARTTRNEHRRGHLSSLIDLMIQVGDLSTAAELAEEVSAAGRMAEVAKAYAKRDDRENYKKTVARAQQLAKESKLEQEENPEMSPFFMIAQAQLAADEKEAATESVRQALLRTELKRPSLYSIAVYSMVASFFLETEQLPTLSQYWSELTEPTNQVISAVATASVLNSPDEYRQFWKDGSSESD